LNTVMIGRLKIQQLPNLARMMQMGNGYWDGAKPEIWKDHETKKWNKGFQKWKSEKEKSPQGLSIP
jgi:hypothetical protein